MDIDEVQAPSSVIQTHAPAPQTPIIDLTKDTGPVLELITIPHLRRGDAERRGEILKDLNEGFAKAKITYEEQMTERGKFLVDSIQAFENEDTTAANSLANATEEQVRER